MPCTDSVNDKFRKYLFATKGTLKKPKYHLGFNTLQILDLKVALKNFVYPLNIQVKPRSEKPEKTYNKVSTVP